MCLNGSDTKVASHCINGIIEYFFGVIDKDIKSYLIAKNSLYNKLAWILFYTFSVKADKY